MASALAVLVTVGVFAALVFTARSETPSPVPGCEPPEGKQIMDLVRILRRARDKPAARRPAGRHRSTT